MEYAFPHKKMEDGIEIDCAGMSLRDYFAGQALTGILASMGKVGIYEAKETAHKVYQMADEMLAASLK